MSEFFNHLNISKTSFFSKMLANKDAKLRFLSTIPMADIVVCDESYKFTKWPYERSGKSNIMLHMISKIEDPAKRREAFENYRNNNPHFHGVAVDMVATDFKEIKNYWNHRYDEAERLITEQVKVDLPKPNLDHKDRSIHGAVNYFSCSSLARYQSRLYRIGRFTTKTVKFEDFLYRGYGRLNHGLREMVDEIIAKNQRKS